MRPIEIKKSDGTTELFDQEKLRASLLRASASMLVTNDVIQKVEKRLKAGMTTSEIYRIAFELMRKKEKGTALRYSLRRSLLTLGPTGFPFEKFMGRIFSVKGYEIKTGVMLRGRCVSHEVDLVAFNKDELALMEVKFHNALNIKTDTKVALYVQARFEDLKEQKIALKGGEERLPTRCILITNTKFTHNAEKYAACNDMGLISWDYPKKGNLYDLIDETNLIPLTALSTLSRSQKDDLILKDYICCDQIEENPEVLKEVGLNKSGMNNVLKEINLLEEKHNLN